MDVVSKMQAGKTMKPVQMLSGVAPDDGGIWFAACIMKSDCRVVLQELMSNMFLVNIPMIFSAVWKVLSVFVDDRIKAKIRFLKRSDLHVLHEFVPRENLPRSLGGLRDDKLISDKNGEHVLRLSNVLVCLEMGLI